MNPQDLCDLSAPVVFFPVRHHSPAAARLVRALALRLQPRAILIEGPVDYNDRLHELLLPHRLPLAIYSFVRLLGGQRRGAYYPLCEHSPEWQALRVAEELATPVQFIDLPWADVAGADEEPSNRYADAEFHRSRYIPELCRKLGVDDFNTLWDTLFELDPDLPVETYLERCHLLCGQMRLLEGAGSLMDRRREAFMAGQVRRTLRERGEPVLVVTGGYHSLALHARLSVVRSLRDRSLPQTPVLERPDHTEPAEMVQPDDYHPQPPEEGEERGVALTPYSFERLDALMGYEAGMPNPGFYHQLWQDRQAGRFETHQALLRQVARRLRDRQQAVSAADLIAAEMTARGLAALRGHAQVWRTDLVDGLVGALIKEELATGGRHPLLEVIHEVLRGGERGVLAKGTVLPPLVHDVQSQLAEHNLQALAGAVEIELNLDQPEARPRSRVLHRLRLLEVSGYVRTGGTDLAARDDLSHVWESWQLSWSPDFDARCIEAARYGPTLAEAAAARLAELAATKERDAAAAAVLLLDAALAGLTDQAAALLRRLQEIIRTDGNFLTAAGALRHLLYLYRYDRVLETAGLGQIGGLLRETFDRCLWLLESLGQVTGQDRELIDGVRTVRETFDRCAGPLNLNRDELLDVLRRVGGDAGQTPPLRGAALGALWSLGASDARPVLAVLRRFADPDHLGDFLAGLFALAREQVQRQRDLVLSIHELLGGYADEQFLAALPALRLAFTYFTPREKHHLAVTLRQALGFKQEGSLAALQVSVETAARALAFEGKLLEALARYGLRGGERV